MRGNRIAVCSLLLVPMLLAKDWWMRKPYNTWSKQECREMMDDSPWSASETRHILRPDSSTSGTGFGNGINPDLGQPVTYHVRFLTAKPVRIAMARSMLIDRGNEVNEATLANLVGNSDEENIVIALEIEVDHRFARFRDTLIELRTSDLISNTYLKTDTGKVQFLRRYEPPGKDGSSAKFIFARRLADGTQFITAQDRKVHFDTDLEERQSVRAPQPDFDVALPGSIRLSIMFDLRKMIFDGKLEI